HSMPSCAFCAAKWRLPASPSCCTPSEGSASLCTLNFKVTLRWLKSRKTEPGANQFQTGLKERAAPFALSTRVRLMLWSTSVLLLALLLLSVVVYSYLRSDLLAEVDGRLYAKANGVRTVMDVENVSGPELALELDEFAAEIPEGNR